MQRPACPDCGRIGTVARTNPQTGRKEFGCPDCGVVLKVFREWMDGQGQPETLAQYAGGLIAFDEYDSDSHEPIDRTELLAMTKPLDIDEVADRYSCSTKSINRRIHSGEFPKGIRIGRNQVWPLVQLLEYEARATGIQFAPAGRIFAGYPKGVECRGSNR